MCHWRKYINWWTRLPSSTKKAQCRFYSMRRTASRVQSWNYVTEDDRSVFIWSIEAKDITHQGTIPTRSIELTSCKNRPHGLSSISLIPRYLFISFFSRHDINILGVLSSGNLNVIFCWYRFESDESTDKRCQGSPIYSNIIDSFKLPTDINQLSKNL